MNTRKTNDSRRSTAVGRIAQVAAEALEERRLFSTIVVTSAADAANYSTSVTVPQLNPGTTPVTLRDAIDAANNTGGSNTIDFSPSLTTSTISVSTSGDDTFGPSAFAISSNLTINGGTTGMTLAGNAANASNRLFYVKSNGNLTLQNLTVSGFLAQGGSSGLGGAGAGLGGAIVNAGSLNLLQDAFVNNQAIGGLAGTSYSTDGGGGLDGAGGGSTGGGPNGGGYGGAGGFGGGGGTGGAGGFGGGSGVYGSPGGFGGGGGWWYGNGGFGAGALGGGGGAGMGGAIFNYGGSIAIADSTFADNSAIGGGNVNGGATGTGLGGAIFNLNGSVAASNDTFAYNAADAGGALYSLGDNGIATQSGPALPSTTATVTLNNSILADSTGGTDFIQNTNDSSGTGNDTGAVSSSGSNNIIQSDASGANAFAGSAANVDPLLARNAPANYGGPTDSFALLPGSPAIDAGSNTLATYAGSTLTTDQRGDARVVNNTVDIGAYESPGFSITAATGSGQSALTGSTFSTALGVTVTANDPDLTDLAGGVITLSAPSSGASASFATNPLTLSSSGTASAFATANSTGGAYTVSASAAGIATAATYSLANGVPPSITTDPASQTFQTGDTGTVTSIASGYPAPTVQWYAEATPTHWDSISYATDTSYSHQFYRVDNGLELQAVFTNAFGSVTSAPATITVIGLTPTAYVSATGGVYTGSPFTATASVAGTSGPAGPTLEGFTPFVEYYTGSTTTGTGTTVAPTAAGTYTAVTHFNGSLNYTSATSTAATFTITQADPAVGISASGGVYDGSSFDATATVTGIDGNPVASLEGVSPTITYYAGPDASGDASTIAPTSAGTYTAVADFPGSTDYSSPPVASTTFVISQATPALSVDDAGGTYSGSAFAASAALTGITGTATTSLDGVTPTLTYYHGTNATGTASTVAPSSAGTYTVVAQFPGSVNYVGIPDASDTFTIAPATAYFTFSNLSPTYDGSAKSISISTDPAGLATSVTYTENGRPVAAPVHAGTYTATATVTDPNYTGSSQITFTVEPARISLSLAGLSTTFNGSAHPASDPLAIAGSSDTTLASLLHLSYQNTVSGTVTDSAPVYPGTYTILASFAGNADYSAIPTFNTGQTVSISPFAHLASPSILQRTGHTALTGQLAGSIPVKGGTVTVQIGGTTLTAKLKKTGAFTVNFPTVSLAAGQYTIHYTYSGPSNFTASTWTSTLTVRPRPTKSKARR